MSLIIVQSLFTHTEQADKGPPFPSTYNFFSVVGNFAHALTALKILFFFSAETMQSFLKLRWLPHVKKLTHQYSKSQVYI